MTQAIYAPEAVETSVLVVGIASETYGIPATVVREVVRFTAFTPVPGAAASLPGVMSRRGAILPVADLRAVLGLVMSAPTRTTRFVLCMIDQIDVALLVDRVEDIVDLAGIVPDAPPATLDVAQLRLLRGVARYAERYLTLLDPVALVGVLREA